MRWCHCKFDLFQHIPTPCQQFMAGADQELLIPTVQKKIHSCTISLNVKWLKVVSPYSICTASNLISCSKYLLFNNIKFTFTILKMQPPQLELSATNISTVLKKLILFQHLICPPLFWWQTQSSSAWMIPVLHKFLRHTLLVHSLLFFVFGSSSVILAVCFGSVLCYVPLLPSLRRRRVTLASSI